MSLIKETQTQNTHTSRARLNDWATQSTQSGRSYSQLILRFGGPRSVLLKMYNFFIQGLLNNKCVDLVVLLNFEDINLSCKL